MENVKNFFAISPINEGFERMARYHKNTRQEIEQGIKESSERGIGVYFDNVGERMCKIWDGIKNEQKSVPERQSAKGSHTVLKGR